MKDVKDRIADPNKSTPPAHKKLSARWFPIVLIVLVTTFIVMITERNRIRAYWWAHQLIHTNDVSSRGYFLASLCSVGRAAIHAIEDLSKADDPDVRAMAVYAYQSMSQEDAIPGLGRLMKDPDADVRESAALALAFLQSSEATRKLCDAAKTTDTRAATAAIAALGRLAVPQAMDAICDALAHHPSPLVRAQAAETLTVVLTGAGGLNDSPVNRPGCDPFQSLLRATTDQALFAGRLALEREIASAARFADSHGSLPSVPISTNEELSSQRSVAEIALKSLSVLTGGSVSRQAIEKATDPVTLAGRCRESYLRHFPRASQIAKNPTSQTANPSDTNE